MQHDSVTYVTIRVFQSKSTFFSNSLNHLVLCHGHSGKPIFE